MIRDATSLAIRDLRILFRGRETWLWTFLMPIVFFYFIGTVTGGFSRPTASKDVVAVVVPPDAGFLADEIVRRLDSLQFQTVRAPGAGEAGAHYSRRLQIPPRFTEPAFAGEPQKLEFTRDGSGIASDYDRFRVSRAVYTVLADYIVLAKDGAAPTAASFARLASEPRTITLDVRSAGRRVEPPRGFEQAVPGTMVMFTMLVLFTSGAVTLTIERNQGLLRRLASAPLSRRSIVLAKFLSRFILGLIQISFAMVTGALLFQVEWGPHLAAVISLLTVYAACAAMLGMLLGNLARTEGQVIGFAVVATNVVAAVGGCWWPIEITPSWMQKLALTVPTGWAMDALHKLVSFGDSPVSVLPHLMVLLATAVVSGLLLARSFRFQ